MPAASIVGVIIGGVVDAFSSGFAAMQMDEQKDMIRAQQAQLQEQAVTDVKNVQDKGRRVAAAQNAALAAAGVRLDETGTSKTLLDETKRLTDKDALAVMTTAGRQIGLLNMQKNALTHSQQRIFMANMMGMNSAAAKVGSGIGSYIASTNNSQTANQIVLDAGNKYNSTIPKYSLLGGSSLSTDSSLTS